MFLVALTYPWAAWASHGWWTTGSTFPRCWCAEQRARMYLVLQAGPQALKHHRHTFRVQVLLVKAEIWQPSSREGIIRKAGEGMWGMLSLPCRSDPPPVVFSWWLRLRSVCGGKANGIADGRTHSTALWCVPWDNARYHVPIVFSARRKGGCEYARDKLKADCCSVILAITLILLT